MQVKFSSCEIVKFKDYIYILCELYFGLIYLVWKTSTVILVKKSNSAIKIIFAKKDLKESFWESLNSIVSL